MASEEVTSTAAPKTRTLGNSEARAWMADWDVRRVLSKSHRATPLAPCSRSARVAESPRVPAPPVTEKCGQWTVHILILCRFDRPTTLPSTANRARARPSAFR